MLPLLDSGLLLTRTLMDKIVVVSADRPEDETIVLESEDFMECSVCIVQPGMPPLCKSCLHNRTLIDRLKEYKWMYEGLSK